MSVYIPLARKYRPQKFSDVVGQDITVKILTRGMRKNRLGAAMLFSGTRGVGKTTLARILAKAFRCENLDVSTSEPCCVCESCRNFAKDNQIDVIEIDAASNTGVEDVREIIESCRYKPTTGKYKIFIIDEVHMLSKSAFNALLKTLEEPPEHVKFFMATTETYKIPETILSRVLKFDLKKVDTDLMAQYLSFVCNQEMISAGLDALMLIAKAANGSIRDSLSILDQVINASDNDELTEKCVRNLLSLSDESDILELLSLVLSNNVKASVEKYRSILKDEVECSHIVNMLMDFVHILVCLKTNVEPFENNIDDELTMKLQQLSKDVSIPALSRIWQMLVKALSEISLCERPQIVLEMIIVRIAYASGIPDLYELIKTGTFDEVKCNNGLSILKKDKIQSKDLSLVDEALKIFDCSIIK